MQFGSQINNSEGLPPSNDTESSQDKTEELLADLKEQASFFESIDPSKIQFENLYQIDDKLKQNLNDLNDSISNLTEI